MAEMFEEAGELLGDVDEVIEGLAADADYLPEEEREEFEDEAREAIRNVDELKHFTSNLRQLDIRPQMVKKFAMFIAEQAAIGAIFLGCLWS